MAELVLLVVHLGLIGLGFYALIRQNDELPLIIVFAVTYFGFYRYIAIISGLGHMIDATGLYNLGAIYDEELLSALSIMTLGESLLVGAYMLTRRPPRLRLDFSNQERAVSARAANLVLGVAWAILGIVVVSSIAVGSVMSSGVALAFGYGYLTHISFLKIGAAIVLFQVYLAGGIQTQAQKGMFYAFFILLFLNSFQPGERYQFFGWMLGVGMLWSYRSAGMQRVGKLGAALAVILMLVGMAGALRSGLQDSGELRDSALRRVIAAEDANMLEGFAMLMKVYPEMLPYRYGGGHLEILYRPIPRAIWPDKPKGGYFFSIAAHDYDFETRGTTGFSPSLFGSFYEEGGELAVMVFALLYGIGLAKIINWAHGHGLLISGLVRASLAAALVPVLRGGDLPGVFAWLGFSFLLVAGFVYFVKHRYPQAVAAA